MLQKLLERRAAVAARHKVLASVSGSGWHKTDAQEAERIGKGRLPLCERPIAIQDDDRVWIVGPDVGSVMELLGAFLQIQQADDVADPDREKSTMEKFAAKCANRVIAAGGDSICLPTQDWNSINFALHAAGVDCVITGIATPDEEK